MGDGMEAGTASAATSPPASAAVGVSLGSPISPWPREITQSVDKRTLAGIHHWRRFQNTA